MHVCWAIPALELKTGWGNEEEVCWAWEGREESKEMSAWQGNGTGEGKRSGTMKSRKDSCVPAGTPGLPRNGSVAPGTQKSMSL